ncbi:hypothetical protein BDQ12DRAFT_739484 [Crucibulum laeve]|uniref:Uncharacterized protein n=1 Tax=Crucibulum laeve TaxID=68775 RepID=A0A5C3LGR0_9AGAR|nr:hypothetical protein BDQ12DRAFT_739484 [Crucibulum laeve]
MVIATGKTLFSQTEAISYHSDMNDNPSDAACPTCGQVKIPSFTKTRNYRSRSYSERTTVLNCYSRQSIPSSISEKDAAITSLDYEISRTRAALADLEARRRQLQFTLDHEKSLRAPIRRIPLELLGEILLYCCPDEPIYLGRPITFTWQLGHVCSHWRNVVSTLHQLWYRLVIDLENVPQQLLNDRGWETFQILIQTSILRAGDRKLSICFPSMCISGYSWFNATLAMLAGYSDRWGDFTADLSSFTGENSTFLFGLDTPALKMLHLTGKNYDGRRFQGFRSLPCLSHLTLSGFRHPSRTLLHTIPLAQITHFTSQWNMLFSGELMEILRCMPNLVEFETGGGIGTSQDEIAPVLLVHLQVLKIKVVRPDKFALLNALDTPGLTHLKLELTRGPSETQITVAGFVIPFLRRSACTPYDVSFHAIPTSCTLDILRELPSVEKLQLSGSSPISDEMISFMASQCAPSRWFALPRLSDFRLHTCSDTAIPFESLIKMLKTRVKSASMISSHKSVSLIVSLKFVAIQLDQPLRSPNALDELKEALGQIVSYVDIPEFL